MFEKRLKNRIVLKSKFSKRERVFGGWVSFREPAIAEIFAKIGFDFIAIDMEHTTIPFYKCPNKIILTFVFGLICRKTYSLIKFQSKSEDI